MGRPLSRQQLFGANAKNNIKVQFHNGDASVPGYIVEQTGSKRFKCKDKDGFYATCYLKAKASADLQEGEMSITVKDDAGVAHQITKITRHRVSYLTMGGDISMPWNFSTSTSDGYVQIEEAGTDNQLTGSTDLEGDDFDFLTGYPVPGSGSYYAASNASAIASITWQEFGVAFEPAGYKTTSEINSMNTIAGCRRDKALGNFTVNGSTAASAWNYSFWDTATLIQGAELFDKKMSFGGQNDNTQITGGTNFSLQWWGYMNLPTTQKWNFYLHSDDHFGMWIGEDANYTNTLGYSNIFVSSNSTQGLQHNANSVTLNSGRWYPVRFWFSEHSGNCKAQVYAIGEDGTKLNGDMLAGGIQWKSNLQGLY